MPRHFARNHLVKIKKRIGNTADFETLLTFYAKRRDMRVVLKNKEGLDKHEIVTDYTLPPEIVVKLPPGFDALVRESFGDQSFGDVPFGGRSKASKLESIGGTIEPTYYLEDVQRLTTNAIIGVIEHEKGDRVVRTFKLG